MATLQIEVKDKKFASHNNVNLEIFSETYIEANGWKCQINENGDFSCIATEYYSGVRRQIKFRIKKGQVKLLLKIGDGRPKALKSYKLKKWPVDGVIGLPSGFIDKRRAYFRENDFQEFLNKHGLTAVRCEPANGIFEITQEVHNEETVFEELIETDGKSEIIFNDVEVLPECEGECFLVYRRVEITDATWVIKSIVKLGTIIHKILYTIEDPKQIINLP